MALPTLIWDAFDVYSRSRNLEDSYYKYTALEATGATLIKYLGTAFSSIAADQGSSLEEETIGQICSSSSLGGWVSAIDYVCGQSKKLPDCVKDYCAVFSDHKRHPEKEVLDRLAVSLNRINILLRDRGYRPEDEKSLNLRRAMWFIVSLRNKCAHGSLDPPFFVSAEPHLLRALQLMLQVVPFDVFTLWGEYGSYSVPLRGRPEYRRRRRDLHFWLESDLLKKKYTERIPFLLYRAEGTRIYCLNDAVREDAECEFIDYGTGNVLYREVDLDIKASPTSGDRLLGLQPAKLSQYQEMLGRNLTWREIPVTQAAIETQTQESGVYLFSVSPMVYGRQVDTILYVGQTCSLKERLRHYVRTRKGYDVERPEISRMFKEYGSQVRFYFAHVEAAALDTIENAIYQVLRPKFNLISPPKGREE